MTVRPVFVDYGYLFKDNRVRPEGVPGEPQRVHPLYVFIRFQHAQTARIGVEFDNDLLPADLFLGAVSLAAEGRFRIGAGRIVSPHAQDASLGRQAVAGRPRGKQQLRPVEVHRNAVFVMHFN